MHWGWVNPMFGPLAVQGQVLVEGVHPHLTYLAYAGVWALLLFLAGSFVMMSRERDFAVRL